MTQVQVDALSTEYDPSMETNTVTAFPEQSGRKDAARTAILVFTRDATLIDTIRKASPRDATVIHAPDLDQASDQLPSVQPDVLVLDAASAADVATMATQITRQFPDLVIIVAGRREESASLMKLTASGQIYRFLLVPLALGQTRLTLEAALRRHVERSMDHALPQEISASSPPKGPGSKVILAAGIGLLLIAVVLGWFFSRSDSGSNTADVVPAEVAMSDEAKTIAAASLPVQSELTLAARAMERQQFVEPAGSSALDHYRAAMAIEPGNAQARAGIQSVADRIVERAEAALLAERLDQAVAAVELVRNIQPDHTRLPLLDAQLQRERERLQLTQARDVSVKLKSAMAVVNQRLDAGRLITPAGQSARDALFEARRIDATDPAVIQGFRDLTSRLVSDAERAQTAGQREQALLLVAAARELSPSDARVAALERSLTELPQAPAQSKVSASPAAASSDVSIGRTRLAEGKLLEPSGDSARDHLLAARAANANDPEAQKLLTELKERLIDSGAKALGNQDLAGAATALTAAAGLGVRGGEESLASAQRDLERLQADLDFRNNVISAALLQRTKMVAPIYPESARRRGISGWVDVAFTVTVSGTVTDVTVTGSDPGNVFDGAAIQAVGGWRFKPVVRSGNPVPQRAAARIRFDLEG